MRIAVPPTLESVAEFLVYKCESLNHSAKSTETITSHLKIHLQMFYNCWIPTADEVMLRIVIRQLLADDPSPSVQVLPICASHLAQLMATVDKSSPLETATYVAMRVGHDLLLRAGELLLLQKDNLRWFQDYVTVDIVHSKGNKTSTPEQVVLYNRGPRSTYFLLKRWAASHSHAYLFNYDSRDKPLTTSDFNINIRKLISKILATPSRYSGHSLRAGGATDLFNLNIPYPDIKKAGRWKSDAALLYYRDVTTSTKIAIAFTRVYDTRKVLKV